MVTITMGKERSYSFQTDDDNQAALFTNLKKDYELLEDQVNKFRLQKDAGFTCKVGGEDMEYPMDSKGFAKFKKDMEKFYTDKAKCDADKAKQDAEMAMEDAKKNWAEQFKSKQDSVDAEIKVLQAELSNRDSIDTQALVASKAKELAILVNKATTILNVDSASLWDKTETEIKRQVILKTYPTLNVDKESDLAIDAMFKTCEFYQTDSKRIVDAQKQLINNAVPMLTMDSQEPVLTERMQFLTNAYLGGNK
jgi:hypothetical protein